MVEITLLGKVVVAIIAAVLVVVGGDSNRLAAGQQWWVESPGSNLDLGQGRTGILAVDATILAGVVAKAKQ